MTTGSRTPDVVQQPANGRDVVTGRHARIGEQATASIADALRKETR